MLPCHPLTLQGVIWGDFGRRWFGDTQRVQKGGGSLVAGLLHYDAPFAFSSPKPEEHIIFLNLFFLCVF